MLTPQQTGADENAAFGTYKEITDSDDPTQPMTIHDQRFSIDNQYPEFDEKGVEVIKENAQKFFSQYDKDKDVLYFISSNERRIRESAEIYKEYAKEEGFKIIVAKGGKEEGENQEVRISRNLSQNKRSVLIESVFDPEEYEVEDTINFNDLSNEDREKWKRAHKIITDNDQGSWEANFAEHGEAIKAIYGEDENFKTPEDYKKRFEGLEKLAALAYGKIKEDNQEKSVKVLAFGHGDYLTAKLLEETQKPELEEGRYIKFTEE